MRSVLKQSSVKVLRHIRYLGVCSMSCPSAFRGRSVVRCLFRQFLLVIDSRQTDWPIMFYFMGRFCSPNASRWTLLSATLAITLALEFGQLWNPQVLLWLRQKPIIGFILGNHFIWSDVVCCVTGAFCTLLIDVYNHSHAIQTKTEK